MPIVPSFAQFLLDRLRPLGDVRYRAMFGGACLFFEGTAFAIVDDGVVYFKIDDVTKPTFTAAGGRAFTFFQKRTNTHVETAYMTIPEEDVDSPELVRWARLGIEASRRKKPAKKAAPKKTTTTASKKKSAKKSVRRKAARR